MRMKLLNASGLTGASLMLASALTGWGCAGASAPERAGGEAAKEQFRSVVYVRGIKSFAEERELYHRLRPDSLMSSKFSADLAQAQQEIAEATAWGCRYRYEWFNTTWIYQDKVTPPTPDDPAGDVPRFVQAIWDKWDEFRAAGVVTGERPKNFDDLLHMSKERAMALKSGAPPPAAPRGKFGGQPGALHLSLNNPDVQRIMTDITKYRVTHGFGQRFNAFMCDLGSGTRGAEDWSESSQRAFDQWVRARYTPDQIRTIFRTDPAQPVPMWPADAMTAKPDPDLARVYDCMTRRFFSDALADHFRLLKEAAESVLGKGNGGFLVNANAFGWRYQTNLGVNPAMWGDAVQTYCSESGIWPGSGGVHPYAGPRVPDVRSNLFDFQYGAGRLSGEPVMVKAYFYDAKNPQIAQLGFAEGLALLGNMGLYASPGDESSKVTVPGAWVAPMVEFAQTIAPKVRQMIPAGEVGVLFSPVDYFCGFDENYRGVYDVCDILQRQHVPFQLIHLNLLEQHLKERAVKMIIAPWLRCVSDEQAALLNTFARQGGEVFLVGECGTHTWEGVKRERNGFEKYPKGPYTNGWPVAIGQQLGPVIAISYPMRVGGKSSGLSHPWDTRPDSFPALLLNLTRNTDNSRFWMHLLNYDVDMDATKGADAVRPAENVRLVVPLPDGLRAASVTLYRPGTAAEPLKFEAGWEGCRVTVPSVDIYALVEVATKPGERPEEWGLRENMTLDSREYALATLGGEPGAKTLVPPTCPLPPATPGKPQRYVIGTRNYVTVGADREIRMQVTASTNGFPMSYTVYALDGRAVAFGRVAGEKPETVKVPQPGDYVLVTSAGMKRHGVIGDGNSDYSLRFTHPGGAAFEASQAIPLNLRKEKTDTGDAATYYFYVPKACRAFTVAFDMTYGSPARLLVKDPTGAVVLDQTAEPKGAHSFECKPTDATAGKVWSLTIDDPPQGKRKYTTLYLQGLPPVLAETPAQLLIAKGDE